MKKELFRLVYYSILWAAYTVLCTVLWLERYDQIIQKAKTLPTDFIWQLEKEFKL